MLQLYTLRVNTILFKVRLTILIFAFLQRGEPVLVQALLPEKTVETLATYVVALGFPGE